MSFGFGVGDFIAVLDKAKLYRERFADAPDHFDSLIREIASLTSILEYIGRVEDQLTESEKEALAPSIKESTKLLGELEKIFNDNTSLDKHEGTSKLANLQPRAVWRRLRMKPEDIQKLRQRITMNVHFLGAIKGFRDSEAIHSTKRVVTSIHDEQTSRQEREIMDWLTTTDYAPQQRDHLSRRYTGTNQWLLDSDKYKSWISSRSQTLLCPGMPGAGKTIMASVVIDDLFHRYQNDNDVGIAYVYCNFKDQERQNHYDMLSSITKQLTQCRSPIPGSLKALYDAHQKRKTSRTLQETMDVLQTVASSYHRVFVIIDALDECEPKSRQTLLAGLSRLQKRHPTNILATTREIPDIIGSANFKNAETLRIQASDIDVLRYISSRIPDMQTFVQRRPEIQEEIQKGILCRINGMFLLAKLLIDSLSCKTTPKAVRKALAAASAEDDTYAHFYNEALERICVQPPAHVRLAKQVLSWIVFAKRPLQMNELQHALAVEEDEPDIEEDNIPSAEIIISSCGGLVTLDEQGGIVRLVHQTTQEFFNRRKRGLFPEADAEITNTCVRYLCLGQVQRLIRNRTQNIPSYRKPYHFESFALRDLRKSEFPFCEYAILYWGHHAGSCETNPANIVHLLKNREMLRGLVTILSDLIGEDVPSTGAHLAAWFGLLPVFENHLLPAEDVTFVDRRGHSVLSWAAHRGHSDLIKHVLDNDTLRMKKCHNRENTELVHLALFKAVEFSHSNVARRLIQFASDEDLDLQSADGPSLLDLCIERREVTILCLLLDRSQHRLSNTQRPTSIKVVDLEKIGDHGTPLGFAAAKGLDEVVKLVLKHGANVEALDKAGQSPLLRAFQSGHASTIKILLQNGAKHLGQSAESSALWPATNQDLIVELLVNGGADIESRNERGMTVLACAAGSGQLPILVALLDHKANIEARDNAGHTPIWHALMNSQASTFEMLLKRGANFEARNRQGDTPLLLAAKKGFLSMLEMLLKRGANVEARNRQGDTPLFLAANKGLTPMLQMLLNFGAQIHARNKYTGQTPLWNAIACGQTATLQLLISQNPMIEATDRTGRTALSFDAGMSNPSALETLLQHGAVVDVSDRNHRTPLWYAVAERSEISVKTLIDYGADVNCRDSDGITPVMKAAESGQWSMLAKLWQFGADPSAYDKFGRTALSIAAGADRNTIYSTDVLKMKRNLGGEVPGRHKDSSVFDADPPIMPMSQHLTEGRDSHGRTPLWWAITSGKTKLVGMLSKMVDEVEVWDKQCRPPLMSDSPSGAKGRRMVQLLLEHVSQFGPNGERLRSQEGISERAISYVQTFLEFNGIDPNGIGLWHSVEPGMPFPLHISNGPVQEYASQSKGEAVPLQILSIMLGWAKSAMDSITTPWPHSPNGTISRGLGPVGVTNSRFPGPFGHMQDHPTPSGSAVQHFGPGNLLHDKPQ